MREISDAQYQELARYHTDIVDKCKKCGGSGVQSTEVCKCSVLYEWIRALVVAGIPAHYWTYKLKELDVDAAVLKHTSTFIHGLTTARAKGIGMLYCGTSGTGKTTLMCEVGKAALKAGYKVSYLMANDINKVANRVKCGDAEAEELDALIDGDMVLMDELDKMTITQSASMNILNTLKANLSKIWVIATNYTDTQIEEQFGTAMMSLLKRHTIIVPVLGKDLSDGVQKKLRSELAKSEVDEVDTRSLMGDAEEYRAEREKRLRKSYDEVL